MIHYGYGDGDGIQFLIPVGYG